jgi:hypothetical protein
MLEEDENVLAESIKNSSQALASGLFRALKREAQQSTQSIRAE